MSGTGMPENWALTSSLDWKIPQCLQFADGSIQQSIGQVDTTWTFGSGLHVPLTFEVLRVCSHDIVLGEGVIRDNDVFENKASSLLDLSLDVEFFDLGTIHFRQKMAAKVQ